MIYLYIYLAVAFPLAIWLELGIRSSDRFSDICWGLTSEGVHKSDLWPKPEGWGAGVGICWGILWPIKFLFQLPIFGFATAMEYLIKKIDEGFDTLALKIRNRHQKKMKKVTVENVGDIPSDWKVLNVRKSTSVRIRPCAGVEKFKVSWQDAELVSDPALDLIVIQPNGKEYPCKTDIFYETYVAKDLDLSMAVGRKVDTWVKKATTQVVEIPEGFEVEIITLEGVLPVVTSPDFIAIGVKGELYANTRDFFNKNLEVV